MNGLFNKKRIYSCVCLSLLCCSVLIMFLLPIVCVCYASTESNQASYSVDFEQKIEGDCSGIAATYKLTFAGSMSYSEDVVMPNGVSGKEYVFVLPGNTTQKLEFSFPHAGVWSYKIQCVAIDYDEDRGQTIDKDSLERTLCVCAKNCESGGYSYEALWTVNGSKTQDPSVKHVVTEDSSNVISSVSKLGDFGIGNIFAALGCLAIVLGGIFFLRLRRANNA